MKYKLGATIPTTKYGNLLPEIELEGDDLEALHAQAAAHIEKVWEEYGEVPMKGKVASVNPLNQKEILTFTGEKILYDDVSHTYWDKDGNVLLSGSKYAEQFSKPFDAQMMAEKAGKSWGVDEKMLAEFWKLNGQISNEYGSSIHSALEAYHRYGAMGETIKEHKKLKDNYVLPKNKHIRWAVEDFIAKFGSNALPEVMVSDVKNKRAGQIDRLVVINPEGKVCRVQDFKSNNELTKEKIRCYQHQLSFYAGILTEFGWTVEGLDIFHLTDKGWEKTEMEVLPIK